MATINRLVLDLSHHEVVQDWQQVKADGIVGIIYKATQGTSYHDPTYWEARTKARAAGLLWGSYHFGDASTVADQVRNYIAYAKPTEDELICLDFERNKSNTMALIQAQAWIEEVEKELGRPNECVIYSGDLLKERLGDKKNEFWGARRLWLAQYGNNPVVQKSWDTYWLWQYSDGESGPEPHDVNGIKDAVDSNSFDGTPQELAIQWPGHPATAPEPEKPVVKILVTVPPGVKLEVTQI